MEGLQKFDPYAYGNAQLDWYYNIDQLNQHFKDNMVMNMEDVVKICKNGLWKRREALIPRFSLEFKSRICMSCNKEGKIECKTCGQFYCTKLCMVKNKPFHELICAKTLSERMRNLLKLDLISIEHSKPMINLSHSYVRTVASVPISCTTVSAFTNHCSNCNNDCEHCIFCQQLLTYDNIDPMCGYEPFSIPCELKGFACVTCMDNNLKMCTLTLERTTRCPDRLKLYRSKYRLYMLCCVRKKMVWGRDVRLLLWKHLLAGKNCRC